MSEIRTYVAMGSSFAAGPTIEPVEDPAAMRSARNYAHLAAEQLGAELIDLTVSGATTATILDEPQPSPTGGSFAPQIEGVPAHADIVTVTAGGNDLGFLGSMLFAAWSDAEPDGPLAQMMAPQFAGGTTPPTAAMVTAAATGLSRIATEATNRAPGARVILVDYLTIIPGDADARAALGFTPEQVAVFAAMQDAVAEAFRIAAADAGVELLPISSISREHGLGSAEPWVFGFKADMASTTGSFHPNAAGMRAVADELVRLIAA